MHSARLMKLLHEREGSDSFIIFALVAFPEAFLSNVTFTSCTMLRRLDENLCQMESRKCCMQKLTSADFRSHFSSMNKVAKKSTKKVSDNLERFIVSQFQYATAELGGKEISEIEKLSRIVSSSRKKFHPTFHTFVFYSCWGAVKIHTLDGVFTALEI